MIAMVNGFDGDPLAYRTAVDLVLIDGLVALGREGQDREP